MKKAPAAPAITTTPMIVKRYVPMPPVDGRELSFVSFKPPSLYNLAVATSPSTVSVSVLPSVLIEYPFGAFVS